MQSGKLMQFLWALLGLVIVVVLLAAVGALFVLAVQAGSAFGAALVAATATVVAAVLVRIFERNRVMEAIRREQLSKIYIDMAQVLHGERMPQKGRTALLEKFLRLTLVYGSSATLKAYRTWIENLPKGDEWTKQEHRETSLRCEAFVKAMRKELGMSNWGLDDGDLARMRIHDYDS